MREGETRKGGGLRENNYQRGRETQKGKREERRSNINGEYKIYFKIKQKREGKVGEGR